MLLKSKVLVIVCNYYNLVITGNEHITGQQRGSYLRVRPRRCLAGADGGGSAGPWFSRDRVRQKPGSPTWAGGTADALVLLGAKEGAAGAFVGAKCHFFTFLVLIFQKT